MFISAFFISALWMLRLSAWSDDLPSWVEPVREPLVFKKTSAGGYLEITKTGTITRPKPITSADALEKLNPGLMGTLPGLKDLITNGTVSPKFKALYDAKIEEVKGGDVMATNDFFDCATVLNLKDPKSGRSAVLFESNMDTCTDGSDPGRLSTLSDYAEARRSGSYQPTVAYSWAKKETNTPPNPFLKYWDERIGLMRGIKKQVDELAEADKASFWQGMKNHCDEKFTLLEKKASEYRPTLQTRRSLVASLDPFIVVPKTWVDDQIHVGDYAAVVYEGKIYPCIIGDAGPATKTGEGSLKLAQALNPKASSRMSPVNKVSVTYIVFPGTASPRATPDMAAYHQEVSRLLTEIGGLGCEVKLHAWK